MKKHILLFALLWLILGAMFGQDSPTLSVDPTSLNGFAYVFGNGPSESQQVSVSGSNLTADVTVNASQDFQVCETATGTFSQSISFHPNAGTGSLNATVYVRMKAGLSQGSHSGSLTIASSGVDNLTVSLNGTVNAPQPTLTVNPTSLNSFAYVFGNGPSESQQVSVSGSNLTADVTVNASQDFQVCETATGTFSQSISLHPNAGTGSLNTTVYVRMKAGLSQGPHSGSLTIASSGVDNLTVSLNGTVNAPNTFTISVSANPISGGSPYIGNTPGTTQATFTSGQQCTVHANPATGYNFIRWTENGNTVSTNADYTFNVTANRNLVAQFSLNSYTISVSADPSNGGTVTGGGAFHYNDITTVYATPNQNFTFTNWTENGNVVSTQASYLFTVTSNRNLVAHFTAQAPYTVTVAANPTNGGSPYIGNAPGTTQSSFTNGQQCTVHANPAAGYYFIRWTENGNPVSTNADYTFNVTANRNLVAQFQPQPQAYTITVSASPSQGGSPYIGNTPGTTQATFNSGQSCTVHANTANGFEFVNWTVNGGQVSTSVNYTFTVTSNRTLVAHFTPQAPNTYTITATADPANGGSVIGGGTYVQGATCTLTATPNTNTGYEFVNWTENGQQVSTNPNYSFPVTESAAYVAHFRLKSFTINVSADPSNGGTVSGSGTYEYGITCIVSATPKAGFSFTNWTENGNVVSTQANYQFTVTSNRTLVAHFTAQAPNTYTITVSANPTSGGSPYVGNIPGTTQATFASGLYCTVHANPINGYTFTNWTENGQMVPNAGANYTFTVTSNRNLVAHYQTGPTEYTIITNVIPTGSGIVTGGGTYSSGVQATLTAIANEGYTFEHWQDGNTDNPRSITVTGNATYTAYFTQLPQYTITATADPDEGGIVEGGGQYFLGATCSLHASANEGYYFVNWTKDGSDFSILPDTSFVVTENATYEAHFFQGSGGYTISVRANPEEGGNVTGSGTYVQDIPITLIATPNEGYEFTNWTENGVIQCLTNQYEFVVDRNRVLVANFEQLPVFTISASAGENGSIDPQGDIQVVKGSDITFTIRPDFGFRITSVMVDGNNTGQADTYTFTNVDCNHTIHVSFNGWGIEDYNAAEVKVYPNPANDKVHVEGEGIESVALFDLLGNCLRNMDFSTSNTLNVSGLSKGIYVLMLTTQDGRIGYQKLIIAK